MEVTSMLVRDADMELGDYDNYNRLGSFCSTAYLSQFEDKIRLSNVVASGLPGTARQGRCREAAQCPDLQQL